MAKKLAVSIGINHYANMPDLDFAKNDAEKMRDWFAGSGFESIYLFTDDSPPIEDASEPYDSIPTRNILKRFLRIRFKEESLGIEDSIGRASKKCGISIYKGFQPFVTFPP